ncbi:hypothetical protein F2Q69_00049332 [Brassica cretica]|uniref:Uncharacterized protein n=1 Tax=Brassica cretica TaxID=69181 RepID=A0A8S9Q269_BRACR|nr:hypothetical protein F2Q69_00049332 [Brassica cretica]
MELDRDFPKIIALDDKQDIGDIPVVDIDVILQNGMATTTPSPPVHPQVNANLIISNAGTNTLVAQNLSNNLDKQSSLVHS